MTTYIVYYYKIDIDNEFILSSTNNILLFVNNETETYLSHKYPPNGLRKYVNISIADFITSRYSGMTIYDELPFLMLYASIINPFKTEYFTWISISQKLINRSDTISIYLQNGSCKYISANISLIKQFAESYLDILQNSQKFKTPLLLLISKKPELFTIDTETTLSIAIIGPGIMPIPPKGWGAVEILVWDYAKTLEKQGHRVTIINTKDMDEAAAQVASLKPDFVHIQYDDHAHLCEKIWQHTRAIGITTHYGYLEQPDRWSSYAITLQRLVNQTRFPNVFHFTLSEGISKIYQQIGVPADRILLAPNGANPGLFKFHQQPAYPERSICLGKIEDRKRQWMLQEVPSLYFAGNVSDHRFYNADQYLGEWSKDYLYENLSHYGNLVLLSDGEADPLVVKEALISGMGVVISKWATANLDLTLPFITVIPEDKIGNTLYVSQKIKENRDYSVAHRAQIRAYGLTFSWDTLIHTYVTNIKNILNK